MRRKSFGNTLGRRRYLLRFCWSFRWLWHFFFFRLGSWDCRGVEVFRCKDWWRDFLILWGERCGRHILAGSETWRGHTFLWLLSKIPCTPFLTWAFRFEKLLPISSRRLLCSWIYRFRCLRGDKTLGNSGFWISDLFCPCPTWIWFYRSQGNRWGSSWQTIYWCLWVQLGNRRSRIRRGCSWFRSSWGWLLWVCCDEWFVRVLRWAVPLLRFVCIPF